MPEQQQHIPVAGGAQGLEGRAYCGAWAEYLTGDHGAIRDGARRVLRDDEEDHDFCPQCLAVFATKERQRRDFAASQEERNQPPD